jgi:hypothetical protein
MATALGARFSRRCHQKEAWSHTSVREDRIRPRLSYRSNQGICVFALSFGDAGAGRCVRWNTTRRTCVDQSKTRSRSCAIRGLQIRWRNDFGQPPPEHLNRYLLFPILAYRLQADRHGDLDAHTVKVLRQVSTKGDAPQRASKELAKADQRRFALPPGIVLVREWDRRSHRVMEFVLGAACSL